MFLQRVNKERKSDIDRQTYKLELKYEIVCKCRNRISS